MQNFRQRGEVLDYVVPAAGVKSGDVVIVGGLIGIATCDGVQDEIVAVNLSGVYTLPKGSGALAQGVPVYWNATTKVVTATATDNTAIGNVMDPVVSATTEVNVRLKN